VSRFTVSLELVWISTLTHSYSSHRNEQFLSSLPSGLVCLASHQIAGRGRGGNSWVSPAGCLQFSLILRLSSSNAPKIVFLQYLFGLAVVEAIRGVKGYEEVGVRLKWPNDIYGEVVGEGEGMERYRKIGGILVNSSYAGDDFTLVVGEFYALSFHRLLLSVPSNSPRLPNLP
jgi:biotin---protein ligase